MSHSPDIKKALTKGQREKVNKRIIRPTQGEQR
jgi:hypothetical protein